MTTEATFAPPPEAEGLSLRLLPHALRPVPYLAQEMFEGFMRAFGGRAIYINGFAYIAPGGGGEPPNPLEPSPYTDGREAWEKHAPHCREICEGLWSQDYKARPIDDLAKALPGYFAEAARAFAYTMQPLMSVVAPMGELLAFCGEKLGPDGPRIGMTLLQGFENDSAARGLALEELASLAQASPQVLGAVGEGDLQRAQAADGGEAFAAALDAYLEAYGRGSPTWWELHEPTWGEDPSLALRLLSSYAADPQRGPAASRERAVAERDAAIAKCEANLPGDEDRERFRTLLAAASDYVSVVEGRAHWQQNCVGALRPVCLALGQKLAARGSLVAAQDIFHLKLEELAALTDDRSALAPAAVAERTTELANWSTLDAPLFLGPPPEAPPPGPKPMTLMLGGSAERSDDPTLLKGVGASRGTVEARARVILSLDDAARLQPGEVLVCPFTAPSWMPLSATAGAIVTNQGGVLSHAAIEAREYGLPCVVGTEFGTQRIPDGALVTIDGLAGTVRIHPA